MTFGLICLAAFCFYEFVIICKDVRDIQKLENRVQEAREEGYFEAQSDIREDLIIKFPDSEDLRIGDWVRVNVLEIREIKSQSDIDKILSELANGDISRLDEIRRSS